MEDQSEPRMTRIVERNIEALVEHRKADEAQLTWQERAAHRITAFAGTMNFVFLHLLIYGLWIALNLGAIPGWPRLDPTFVILAVVASVEALFLSTLILITQNRMQAQADKRADLNLQISLLAEHEITRLVKMVAEIGQHMNLPGAEHPELDELKKDVAPEKVLDTLQRHEQRANTKSHEGSTAA